MKVGLAQVNPTVGDLEGNSSRILQAYGNLKERGADLVVAPELAITGYPPKDLLFKSRFVPGNLEALQRLHESVDTVPLLTGYVAPNEGTHGNAFFNAAALLVRGQPMQSAFKSLLPTYDVFDEARYFQAADHVAPLHAGSLALGVTICEDIWQTEYLPRPFYSSGPVPLLCHAGAQLLVNLSASPFHLGKPSRRREMLGRIAREQKKPLIYCNAVGGNDQLVFDGNSLAFNARGELIAAGPAFAEAEILVDLESDAPLSPAPTERPEELHGALVLGVRDYFRKCGFHSAVVGLSGGIDSAVTAAVAVEALGSDQVLGVTMPSRFSSEGSLTDARKLADNLGMQVCNLPIQETFECFKSQFQALFAERPDDVTEENMQSRIRGMTLMAISNKLGHLLLTTGNKSELAVGYCTIYGDMAGGLAVISDVPKTLVYELARWMNRDREIIPIDTIEKPPSAELRPDQKDSDSLPDYALLDEILRLYVEENQSSADIITRGFEEEVVRWIVRRVDLNEYKRAQAAPGLKVTSRAFGVGRRMPIAQRFVG